MRKLFFVLILSAAPLLVFSGCASLEASAERSPRFKSSTELYDQALGYYQKGQYARAKELFREYGVQYPDSVIFRIALYYLGHCHQMLGDDKEALIIYNRVVATYGDDDFWGEKAFDRIRQIKGAE